LNLGPRSKTVWNILRVALGLLVILPTAAVAASSKPRILKPTQGRLAPLSTLTTINLRDFGAVGDGIADDGPALQSALNALAQAGGGTLYVPPGHYAIVTPVVKQFTSATSIILQGEPSATPISVAGNGLGLNLTSDFIIKVGPANDAISILGAGALRVNDLSFTGVQEVTTDAHVVLKLSEIGDARIQHSEFYGLASLVPRGAIVFAFKSSLSIQDTPFLGCATASGHSTSAVQNVRWNAISLINSKFIDYGQRPGFYSKTPLSPAYSWLGIGNAAALEPSNSRRTAIVNNVFLDEGQYFGISAIPALFDIPSAPFEVYISRLVMNVSNLASVGVYLDEAQKVFIDRSFFGWSHNSGAAIALTGVGEAIFDRLECVAHANTIVADAATQRLTIINSIYTNLISEAPYTVTITTEDPLDDPVQHVRQQYLDIANREPDPVGQFYWADLILRCGSNSVCINEKRSALANYLGARPAEKFSIAGTVRDENGAPLADATVALTGSQSVSTVTDASGRYSFENIATAGVYQVTASQPPYMFQSLTFETPSQDQVGDFSPTHAPYTLSGRILNGAVALPGVTVNLTGSQTMSTLTDAEGRYTFAALAPGNYTVTPVTQYYRFTPQNVPHDNLSGNFVDNFLATPADTVQFSNSNFVASPGSSAVEITVTRAGDTSQPASVKYSTSDGTASQSSDYTATSGILRFLPGESTKTFTVLITVDTYPEGAETANLSLTDPSGFLLGDQRLATLTIPDQSVPVPVTNPIEDARTFISQQYADFLGRLADTGGLDYWTGQITQCGTNVNCISSARVATSAAFFAEPEFQQTGGFIYRLFRTALGHRPSYNQFVDQRGQLQSYGDPAAATVLFARDFVLRSDFLTKYPETLTSQQFVDSLITTTRETTGVDLASQRDSLIADYSTNHDRGRIVRLIADNDLVQRAEYNSAFVLMQYFGYLRRDPDEGGYNFWLDVLNNRQPDNFRGMVCAFVTSREYQERFSSVVPRNDSECGSVH
jgi:hypothetical protein